MFVMMLPRCDNQQLASGTGLEELTTRFAIACQAILHKEDEREARVKQCSHHPFLAWRNGRGNVHRPLSCGRQCLVNKCLDGIISKAARALHLHSLGVVK